MPFPNDENGDVLRLMEERGFDFSKPYNVDCFAIFRTEEMADHVARQFAAERDAGEDLTLFQTSSANSRRNRAADRQAHAPDA